MRETDALTPNRTAPLMRRRKCAPRRWRPSFRFHSVRHSSKARRNKSLRPRQLLLPDLPLFIFHLVKPTVTCATPSQERCVRRSHAYYIEVLLRICRNVFCRKERVFFFFFALVAVSSQFAEAGTGWWINPSPSFKFRLFETRHACVFLFKSFFFLIFVEYIVIKMCWYSLLLAVDEEFLFRASPVTFFFSRCISSGVTVLFPKISRCFFFVSLVKAVLFGCILQRYIVHI